RRQRPPRRGRRRPLRRGGPTGGRRGASSSGERGGPPPRRGLLAHRPHPPVRSGLPEAPLRVALLSRAAHPLHPPGGMEKAVSHPARNLQARGIETVLFTRTPTRSEPFPGEVVAVPYGGTRGSHGRILDRTLRYPRFSQRLGAAVAERVRAGQIDV